MWFKPTLPGIGSHDKIMVWGYDEKNSYQSTVYLSLSVSAYLCSWISDNQNSGFTRNCGSNSWNGVIFSPSNSKKQKDKR